MTALLNRLPLAIPGFGHALDAVASSATASLAPDRLLTLVGTTAYVLRFPLTLLAASALSPLAAVAVFSAIAIGEYAGDRIQKIRAQF